MCDGRTDGYGVGDHIFDDHLLCLQIAFLGLDKAVELGINTWLYIVKCRLDLESEDFFDVFGLHGCENVSSKLYLGINIIGRLGIFYDQKNLT